MLKEKILSVSAIKEGTVIDHIQAGQALKIIRLFNLAAEETKVTVGFNLKSNSMRIKDIIKAENIIFTEAQAGQIAIFSPSATVNVIEAYTVVKKFRVKLPEVISGVLVCPNPRCVTHQEKIHPLFLVEENNYQVNFLCKYCEKFFSRIDAND